MKRSILIEAKPFALAMLIALAAGPADAAFIDKDGKRVDQPSAKKMMEIVSKNLALPTDVLAKSIAYYDPQSRVSLPDVQRAIDWYYSQGMIKEKLDAASLVDKTFALFAQTPATSQQ